MRNFNQFLSNGNLKINQKILKFVFGDTAKRYFYIFTVTQL